MERFIKKTKILVYILISVITLSTNVFAKNTNKEIIKEIDISGKNLSSVIEKILPAVVNISAEKTSDYIDLKNGYYEDNTDNEPQTVGSGFLISDNGYIITNNHIVENADKIFVTLKGSSTKFIANIVGSDKQTDLALLKVNVKVKLPFIEFDKTDTYQIGDQIIVAGNPYNLGTSVSIGIISALNRDIKMSPFDNFIQTDAAINKGNSGGPMFNTSGKVIGVTSAIYSPDGANVGIGFAVPSSTAVPIIEKLKRDGYVRRGWLGITGLETDRDLLKILGLNARHGVLVTNVIKGGPAEKAGISISDIILSYNGHKIKKMKDLPIMVSSTEIGSLANIVVYRKGEKLTLQTKITESKEDYKYDSEYEAIAGSSIEVFDMYVTPINNSVRKRFKLDEKKGLFVLKVKKNGVADKKGMKTGDIISAINQTIVTSKEELKQAVKRARNNRSNKIILIIKSNNKSNVILMPIKGLHNSNIEA